MKGSQGINNAQNASIKFRMPTSENLIPIRLDIEIDGLRLKDAFTWNVNDPDSEIHVFVRRTIKDLKYPGTFITPIVQSIQAQLAEFRSFEGQEMNTGQKVLPLKLDLRVNKTVIKDQFLWDVNNLESDPEYFARVLCKDLEIEDREVGPAIAVAIREQLYEFAIQNVTSGRESRISKKARRDRGVDFTPTSKVGVAAFDLMKRVGNKISVLRRRREWDFYEPVVNVLSNEEVEALDAREERNARLKRKLDDKDDGGYSMRYMRV
jgi:SWI/SNF-related matrix-associated actin-dependent regulator of chromatin subfamily B protein 1